ncbi:MAG: HIT family protein [archaeon]
MTLTPEKIEQIKKQLEGLSPEKQKKKVQEIMAKLSPEEREQLMGGQQQCPFCLMNEGKIPVKKVYEDDKVMAILDINPANKGHVILFPKKHYQLSAQMDDDITSHLFAVANKLSSAVFEVTGAQGTNILLANGPVAGQTAPHVLVNIIPRFENDEVAIGWKPKQIDENEMGKIAQEISVKASAIKVSKQIEVIKPKKLDVIEDKDEEPRIP